MDILLPIIGNVFSLAAFALIAIGVMKVFQVSTEVKEIKDLLRDIQRKNAGQLNATGSSLPQSPEPLMHSINAASKPAVHVTPFGDVEANLRTLDADAYAAALHARIAQEQNSAPVLQPEIVHYPRPHGSGL